MTHRHHESRRQFADKACMNWDFLSTFSAAKDEIETSGLSWGSSLELVKVAKNCLKEQRMEFDVWIADQNAFLSDYGGMHLPMHSWDLLNKKLLHIPRIGTGTETSLSLNQKLISLSEKASDRKAA